MELGDRHNFGKATTLLPCGAIWKPRIGFWEESFLSSTGPLRRFLKQILYENSIYKILDLLPVVDTITRDEASMIVKQVVVEPPSAKSLSIFEWEGVGAMLAVARFFGWHDLHKDNMIFGIDQNLKKLVFGPLDLECVFARLDNLNETHLIPYGSLKAEFSGLSVVKGLLKDSSSEAASVLIGAFLASLMELNKHISTLNSYISENSSMEPIRVVLRSTGEYVDFSRESEDNFLASEIEQLQRKDIPYYSAFVEGLDLYYFSELSKLTKVNDIIPTHLLLNKMPKFLSIIPELDMVKDLDSILKYFYEEIPDTSNYGSIQIEKIGSDIRFSIAGSFLPTHLK